MKITDYCGCFYGVSWDDGSSRPLLSVKLSEIAFDKNGQLIFGVGGPRIYWNNHSIWLGTSDRLVYDGMVYLGGDETRDVDLPAIDGVRWIDADSVYSLGLCFSENRFRRLQDGSLEEI